MNAQYLSHLERTLRAFIRLVNKLNQLRSPDSPLWQEELDEATACLAEAEKMYGNKHSDGKTEPPA